MQLYSESSIQFNFSSPSYLFYNYMITYSLCEKFKSEYEIQVLIYLRYIMRRDLK
jgi:hypothetical protein